eukprot:TRINITY_DN10470_c0_g1_i1.p1 TRINITY_DN10470_c0_g1~~TRINITY_DN10470_c0_g1_i1.p1  ORF type:complete len:122 (+),score=32.97 TRINITY_DN10470_c0_g1_i1:49-414(+)
MALISGLTSKFGIEQSELDKLDEMHQDQNMNDNTNKNKDENEGVTTIGFGNNGVDEQGDQEIFELGSFGAKNKEETVIKPKSRKKRSLNEAGIDVDDGADQIKKMKLNSGDSAVIEKNEEK